MSRYRHRSRRAIPAAAVPLLAPLFRFSVSRRAYILRVVGDRYGPVLQVPKVQRHGGRFERTAPPADSEPSPGTPSGDESCADPVT